jgi:hypothetical protein
MWLVAGFTPLRPGFEPVSGHVGFMVKKVALGQIFSEYFGFPCQISFHQCPIEETVAAVPSGLSLTPRERQNTETCKGVKN